MRCGQQASHVRWVLDTKRTAGADLAYYAHEIQSLCNKVFMNMAVANLSSSDRALFSDRIVWPERASLLEKRPRSLVLS